MKAYEMQQILESKSLDSDVIPFFGGGVTKTMSESSVTFRSINSSALKHIQKQIGNGGVLNEGTLTYRLEESTGHGYIADIEGRVAYTLYVDGNGPKLFETKTGKQVDTGGACFYTGFQLIIKQASQKPNAISEIKRIANKYLMSGYEMKEDPKPFK